MPAGDASFYEVIRTFAGIPLFFNDHVNRLAAGISTRFAVPARLRECITAGIEALSECELIPEVNVRVVVTFKNGEFSILISYIPSSYPTERMYEEGVKLILHKAVRSNPEVKMLNTTLRSSVNEEIARQEAYEALLVNDDGFITEGSRSNVFFISNDEKISTAPDNMVLSGITRKMIIDICRNEGIEIIFEPVSATRLSKFTTVFITGTSPMVLPAERIDNVKFNVKNSLVTRLRELYSEKAEESIRNYLTDNKED